MKAFAGSAVLVLAFVFPGLYSAHAEDMPMAAGMKPMGMKGQMAKMMSDDSHPLWGHLQSLGLDEKQKDAVRDIKSGFLKGLIKNRAEKQIAEVDLSDILAKDPVDIKAAEGVLKKSEAASTEIRLSAIKAMEAVKSKLTPEQRTKLSALIEKEDMAHGMMQCMGCGMMQDMGCGMMQKKEAPAKDKGKDKGKDKDDSGHAH
ncbi:MAG: periplasmic heavy metal sensor [Thermodesulfovibrionales bacterium]|nr:periplasmic heavy metal sensor [Thermodesulfovibrionales bacterium]